MKQLYLKVFKNNVNVNQLTFIQTFFLFIDFNYYDFQIIKAYIISYDVGNRSNLIITIKHN